MYRRSEPQAGPLGVLPFYDNTVAGRYLLESFFDPGARENWKDTVLRATGEPLNAEHFLEVLR